MNLFDELCKDAKADIESGKYITPATPPAVSKEIDKVVCDIEKKMSDMMEKTLNDITAANNKPVDNMENVPESETETETESNEE